MCFINIYDNSRENAPAFALAFCFILFCFQSFCILQNSLSCEWINSADGNVHSVLSLLIWYFARCTVRARSMFCCLFCFCPVLCCSVFVFILRNFYDLMKFFRRDIENASHLRPNWKQLSHYIFKWYLLLAFASFYTSIPIFHLYIKWVERMEACQKCHSFLQLTFLSLFS